MHYSRIVRASLRSAYRKLTWNVVCANINDNSAWLNPLGLDELGDTDSGNYDVGILELRVLKQIV